MSPVAWVYLARLFHDAILGDTMIDWLAEGGQTVDMRALWKSCVGLLTTAGLMILITIVDPDNGAAVHQGNIRGNWRGPIWCSFHRSPVDGTIDTL